MSPPPPPPPGEMDVAPAKRPRISKALDKVNKTMEKKCPYLGSKEGIIHKTIMFPGGSTYG